MKLIHHPATGRYPFLLTIGVLAPIVLSVASTHGWAQLPTANLTAVSPAGGQTGSTLVVSISGSNLDGVDRLLFAHPGITARPRMAPADPLQPARPIANQYVVKIPHNLHPGFYDVRAAGRFGVSNPRRFHVSRHRQLSTGTKNHEMEAALFVELNSTIDGRADADATDFFKISLPAEQRLIVDCLAQRIDSKMMAALVLYDAAGKELVRSRDVGDQDPLLDFTAPQQGEYFLAVYDFLHRGGSDYPYRVVLHDGPHIDFVLPPAGKFAATSRFTVYGRNLPGGRPVQNIARDGVNLEALELDLFLPKPAEIGQFPLGSAVPLNSLTVTAAELPLPTSERFSHPVLIREAAAPVTLEREPNDLASEAQRVTPSCEIAGQFYPAGDIDWIEFKGRKGETWHVEVISHRLGVGSDPTILVQQVLPSKEGAESVRDITSQDDPGDRNRAIRGNYDASSDDPSFRFAVPADGTYRIAVRDQFNTGRADPRRVYRLVIRRPTPDFRLLATPTMTIADEKNKNRVSVTSTVLRRGASAAVDLSLIRVDGFEEEVTISVDGLPAGVTCSDTVIPADATRATLVLSATDQAVANAGLARIVGRGWIADREEERRAVIGSVVWNVADRRQQRPRFRPTRHLAVAVIGEESAVARVAAEPDKVWETAAGGKLEIPIQIDRSSNFTSALKLSAYGLPGTLKANVVSVTAKGTTGKLELDANQTKLKPGLYTFCLRAETKFKYGRNQEAIQHAETEQKRLAMVVEKLTAQAGEAEARLKESQQSFANAKTTLQQATESQLTAQQSEPSSSSEPDAVETILQKATTRLAASEESMTAAQQARDAAQSLLKKATELKKSADKNLKDERSRNKTADVTDYVYSAPISVRIVSAPINLTLDKPVGPVNPDSTIEIPVSIQRQFGFAGDVNLDVLFEKRASGLGAAAVKIPSDKSKATLRLNVAGDAAPGDRRFVVQAETKFNNVVSRTEQTIRVQIDEPGS